MNYLIVGMGIGAALAFFHVRKNPTSSTPAMFGAKK